MGYGMGSSAYGGYGGVSGYGGYGGMSGYGGYGVPPALPPNAPVSPAMRIMETMQMISQSFARTAAVLDQNLFALRGSYMSIQELLQLLSPVTNFGPLRWVFALARFILRNFAVLLGLSSLHHHHRLSQNTPDPNLSPSDFKNFQSKVRSSRAFAGLVVVAVFAVPFIIAKFFRSRMESQATGLFAAFENEWNASNPPATTPAVIPIGPAAGSRIRALFDYNASSNADLSFRSGEMMVVQGNQPGGDGWWRVVSEQSGRQGLVPSNFVEVVDGPNVSRK